MLSGRFRDSIAIRMQAGEPVHETLLAECRRRAISAAFVSSGIGMLDTPELAYYDFSIMGYQTKTFPGRHELLNLSGNISVGVDGESLLGHLHATLSHTDFSVFGGHLMQARVGLTVEVVLHVLEAP